MTASDVSQAAVLRRVLDMTGLTFPRGLLGSEATDLAAFIGTGDPDPVELRRLVRMVAAAQWPMLQGPTRAALAREPDPGMPGDLDALVVARAVADDPDPGNPLALALAERAGFDLAAVRARALDRLEVLAVTQAGGAHQPAALTALAATAGRIVVDLLALDPDDFAPEIAAYADAEASAEREAPDLARATGDMEIREWAREALMSLDIPAPPLALASVRGLAQGPVPQDPAHDVVWIATMLALADEAMELAAADQSAQDDPAE